MREIVFDTETTGLDPFQGDKIVEIGAVELINHVPTGRKYHQYINPERTMSAEVIAVHGLTDDFLADKPVFKEIADDFLAFIGSDSKLVAHNASFDMKFVNAELAMIGYEQLSYERVIDTLVIAKQRFPGARVNLNELCKRFNVDNSARTVHGALLDSELLADVYLELLGGREPGLLNHRKTMELQGVMAESEGFDVKSVQHEYREPRSFEILPAELEQHIEFVKKIKNNLWGISE